MKISKSWVYAGLVIAAGLGMMRIASAATPRLQRGQRILVVGDSLAVGTAPHFQALGKEAGIEVKVLAKVGTRIDQWAQSQVLQQTLDSFQPDIVLISLGTNDEYMSGDAVKRQAPFLEQLLTKLENASITRHLRHGVEYIVWIGPPKLPRATNGIAAMIQNAAGNVLAPRFAYFHSEQLDIPRGPDKIHPTARGYAGWAGAVWHWMS